MSQKIVNFRLPDGRRFGLTPACADGHPDDMYPHAMDVKGIEAAKDKCRRCPILDDCLTESLADPGRSGIWGGLDADERETLRRSSARKRLRESR